LGEKLVEQLVESDRLKTPADIYRLTEETLERSSAWARSRLRTCSRRSTAAGKRRCRAFIYALGIRNVGESTARDLANSIGDVEALMDADDEQLQEVPDVGPVVAQSIAQFFHEPHNRKVVNDLLAGGVRWKAPKTA
jgi:DNA ligase (NAD+)